MKKGVLEVRPTQFVLGMREVEAKVRKLESLKGDEVKDWLEDHVVPCVLGPKNNCYLIDHHHAVSACYHAGIDKILIKVEADKSALEPKTFWEFMRTMNWIYLYDQFGNGPHDPARLPFDIRCMSDDPYRSLAWELRQAGVIAKVQRPFAEFVWAKWLRERLPFDLHHESWDSVVKQAIKLAQTHPDVAAKKAN
jgi:hypothetical protein